MSCYISTLLVDYLLICWCVFSTFLLVLYGIQTQRKKITISFSVGFSLLLATVCHIIKLDKDTKFKIRFEPTSAHVL